MNEENLSGTSRLTFSATATLSAKQERTGRYITADSNHALVQQWSVSKNYSENEVQRQFVEDLSVASEWDCSGLICYRGQRRFPRGTEPSPIDMGPPPEHKALAGRYNNVNQSVLYLCESEQGVVREQITGPGPLWIQKFLLPASSLRIADLRPGHTTALANQVLWFAEHAGEGENTCGLAFSQHVAELIARMFDGTIVPGVRGNPSVRYSNIVILKRVTDWGLWLYPDTLPRQVVDASDA